MRCGKTIPVKLSPLARVCLRLLHKETRVGKSHKDTERVYLAELVEVSLIERFEDTFHVPPAKAQKLARLDSA
jgi:hypothetical protein